MPRLELCVTCDQPTMATVGEIYPDPLPNETTAPLQQGVVVRASLSANYDLPPGRYAYYFHIEGPAGKLTLVAKSATPPGQKTFDTQYGYYGKVFKFSVPR